jgi:hypothetical protein
MENNQWQPIETAPKDALIIWLYQDNRANYGDRYVFSGNWDIEKNSWVSFGDHKHFCTKPTHWQPFHKPAPPKD